MKKVYFESKSLSHLSPCQDRYLHKLLTPANSIRKSSQDLTYLCISTAFAEYKTGAQYNALLAV